MSGITEKDKIYIKEILTPIYTSINNTQESYKSLDKKVDNVVETQTIMHRKVDSLDLTVNGNGHTGIAEDLKMHLLYHKEEKEKESKRKEAKLIKEQEKLKQTKIENRRALLTLIGVALTSITIIINTLINLGLGKGP